MKQVITIVGIILIIFGIGTLGYRGYTYTTQEKVAQLGSLEVTAEKEKTVYVPPLVGGASLVVGIILLVVARRGTKL